MTATTGRIVARELVRATVVVVFLASVTDQHSMVGLMGLGASWFATPMLPLLVFRPIGRAWRSRRRR